MNIKIDGEFIADIDTEPTAIAIVKAMNDVAHVMGLKTMTEFVETESAQNTLREIGLAILVFSEITHRRSVDTDRHPGYFYG